MSEDSPTRTPIAGANATLSALVWPGDGTPALLVHGLDGAAETWGSVAEAVAEHRRLVAVDLRGRGSSPGDGNWGVAAHAADVIAAISDLDRGPVVLVGHSFGAHVAAAVAAGRPELVERLVLIDGGTPRRLGPDADRATVAATVAANISAGLDTKPYPVVAAAVQADCISMFCDAEANDPVFTVAVPVTMVRGSLGVAEDLPPVVPDAAVEELAIAGVAVDDHLVDGHGHFSLVTGPAAEVVTAIVG